MPTLCLNMIVKDEARVIRRCLEAVRPWIDSWLIVDTGSSDGTQALVREILAGLPGELVQRPWVDFGHNRSEAIALAGTRADYLLFIDADEIWRVPDAFRWPELGGDCYHVNHRYGGMDYQRATLAATRLPWRFEGVLHEYLDCAAAFRVTELAGPWIEVHPDGARSQDPAKFLKDAALLEAALAREPGQPRYTFYLAQSYRDAGMAERSLARYRERAAMGGWAEEVWYARLQVALLLEGLGRAPEEVLAAYLEAYAARASRPETLGHLARYYRLRQQYDLAHLFAERAKGIAPTADLLFVDPSFAQWRNLDEYAVACYWTGRHRESRAACLELLGGRLPEAERVRVQANLAFAETALRGGGPA